MMKNSFVEIYWKIGPAKNFYALILVSRWFERLGNCDKRHFSHIAFAFDSHDPVKSSDEHEKIIQSQCQGRGKIRTLLQCQHFKFDKKEGDKKRMKEKKCNEIQER